MKFTITPLPYPTDSLSPLMSRETLEYHWGKHYQGYIDKLNTLLEDSVLKRCTTLEEIMFLSEGAIYNNAAQAWNHKFFFEQFSGAAKEFPHDRPSGELLMAVDRCFGSFENFVVEFTKATVSLFGSGWVWLTVDENKDLFIVSTSNAKNPATEEGLRPILVIDVWEHAYYLDHQNRRGDFIANFMRLIDWSVIEKRY